LRDDANAAVSRWQEIADLYESGESAHPDRFALSALVCTPPRGTAGGDRALGRLGGRRGLSLGRAFAREVEWGVAAIRATGGPFEPDGTG
jgi:hypothetical protein